MDTPPDEAEPEEPGTSTGEEMPETDGPDDEDMMRLDVPDNEDENGCRKIDFLFIIDNSLSMVDEQQRLIDGFPGFIAAVQETISDFDYHVMVTATDAAEMSFDPCDNTLGSGRARNSDGEDCGLLDDYLHGQRYIDPSIPDLAEAFACIADVGVDGKGDEKPIWALGNAVTELQLPGACNEGFLREDAILVVTIITDEDDNPDDGPPGYDFDLNSPGTPGSWSDGLVAAKLGDEKAAVVLALVGDSDLSDGACEPYVHPEGDGAEPGKRLRRFAEMFTYGSWDSVCQDSYADFFNDAVAQIDGACAEFTPPG